MDSHDIPSLDDPHAVPTDPYRGRAQPIHNLPIKVEAHEEDIPTDSHALAIADHDEKGAAQVDHGNVEVRDLGWSDEPHEVPTPLGGRSTKRRIMDFKPPLGGLDLNIADEEEFSPDKLRANIERLYMTVVIGLVNFWKHIARLRSWKERDRTVIFASIYFLAWLIDFLVPTIIGFVVVLIAWPPSREYCFPPAPPALIDSTTGGIKKPTAGVLGNDTSLTGAPEKYQGEAVEQEASNFVNSFTSIAISSAAGKHPQGDPHGDEAGASVLEDAAPDPTQMAVSAADAKGSSAGDQNNSLHDKTKEPMSAAMWSKTRPIMHAIADISDGWERFANALSPTPPFPQETPRLKLAACLAPLLLISMFTSSYMFMKMNGFFIGNTLLKGVPTNAQLTITLLRIGEANKAPIPPPPSSSLPPPDVAHATAGEDLDHLGVSDAEMANAIHPDTTTSTAGIDEPKPKKKGHRILAAFKSVTKGGVETVLGTDKLKAAAGAEHAKNRLGGKKGHAYITATATTPALSWTTEREDIDPVFSIAIADIMEIKKVGGLGWKTKLVVGWATSREIADGILIIDKAGEQKQLTAISLREELFNRLISMGAQMWEAW
ncbi:hypothetical protein EYC84_011232 [Monilinia fructicola]|uniref:Uncharacterized protein n=1 Tax=Monilinia fructicola TaxID=38448 RepID=A0A5M9J4T9_MONFR|nr:hypothetical protein EYC84_011232 [Monilinia fructicola]